MANRSYNDTNNLTNIEITDFSLVGGRLQCNLTADGTILDMSFIGITNIINVGILSSLQNLYLNSNQIVTFNPTIALPSSLQNLNLNSNQILTFNPTIRLPSSLQSLELRSNQIVDFNPTIALPSSLQGLNLDSNQIVDFNPTIALPSSLQSLYLNNNQIVDFNPTIALPSILLNLGLESNQMTVTGYTNSEVWANNQPSFTNPCQVYFNDNIDSISGTNLETILISKNCIVNA